MAAIFAETTSQQVKLRSMNRELVLSNIENLNQTLLQDLFAGQDVFIPLRTRTSNQAQQTRATTNNYRFPATSHRSAWRFAVVLGILNIIHNSLASGAVVSKRDIYYQDPDLYRTQAVVDKYVDDIAFTFGVSRTDLNVAAEAKGLLAGPLHIYNPDGTVEDISFSSAEGASVPISSQFHDLSILSNQAPRFLLVIEKKATFHKLSRSLFHLRNYCVLLTGQGYPDLATRAFLHYFHTTLAPQVPCYGLVDFDPDGLSIYNVYTNGSQALSHESHLVVEDLKLLGMTSDDAFSSYYYTKSPTKSCADHDHNSAVQETGKDLDLPYLSQRERQRAKGLLSRLTNEMENDIPDEEQRSYMLQKWGWQETRHDQARRESIQGLRRELQICMMMGYKVEIQILDNKPGGLEGLIMSKINTSL